MEGNERSARIQAGLERRKQVRLERVDVVDVAPLRQRFHELEARGEITLHAVADLMGWNGGRKGHGSNTSRVTNRLGITARPGAKPTSTMDYDEAVKLTHVLGADPMDMGT